MKANELRVGNIIEVEGKYITPSHLKENHFCWVIKVTEKGQKIYNPYLPYTDERVKPIPLTEELVFKAGFIHYDEDDNNNTIYAKGCYYIKKKPFSNNFFFVINKIDIKIEYLHELQNLYFALTKEELNIKL